MNKLYNRELDGLRGVAAFTVIISHFLQAYVPTAFHHLYPEVFPAAVPGSVAEKLGFPWVSLFYNGHFSVCVFFVLSGYVLALPYWQGQREILWQRLGARYLRLNLPVAASLLISFILLQAGLYFNQPAGAASGSDWMKNFLNHDISLLQFVKMALYKTIVKSDNALNMPLWTLKLEFVGSLWLLFYFAVLPTKKIYQYMAPLLLGVLLHILHPQSVIFYMAIIAGGYLAGLPKLTAPQAPVWLIGIFILGCYLGGFSYDHMFYDWLPQIGYERKSFYNILGAIAVVYTVSQGYGRRFFAHPMIQYLGRFAFPVYLLHFLLLFSLSAWLYLQYPPTPLMLLANFGILVVVTYMLAALFERWIDLPAIHIARRFGKWAVAYGRAHLARWQP